MAPAAAEPDVLQKSLKDLNLTNEEMTKFEKAFKDPEFLRLFEEYAKEVSDPKVKAETDQYLRQLEAQGRGEDVYGKGVQLVVPNPAFVLKSKVLGPATQNSSVGSKDGKTAGLPVGQKVFINVCSCDKVDRYSLKEAKDAAGRTGQHLSIPLTLGPMRVGKDKQGQPAAVYDFVVHPASIEFAANHAAAMDTLADTALEHVERVSGSRLHRSWRRLNTRYKATEGHSEPPVQAIRTAEGGESVGGRLRPRSDVPAANVLGAKSSPTAPADEAHTGAGMEGPSSVGMESAGKAAGGRSSFSFDRQRTGKAGSSTSGQQKPVVQDPPQAGYQHPDGSVTPAWSLVHRGETDLAETWGDAGRGLALQGSVPRALIKTLMPTAFQELVVRVMLPELNSAAGVDLDVGDRRMTLKVPGRYLLQATLPYAVDDSKGKAKFDKARKQLEITLPVIPPPPPPQRSPGAAAVQEPTASGREEKAVVEPDAAEPLLALEASTADKLVSPDSTVQGQALAIGSLEGHAPSDTPASTQAGQEAAALVMAATSMSPCGSCSDQHCESVAGAGGSTASGGDGHAPKVCHGGDRELTENERRWHELHAPKPLTQEVEQGTGTGQDGAQIDGAGVRAEGGGHHTGVVAGVVVAVAAEEAQPTVLLRPRLRHELAMELD